MRKDQRVIEKGNSVYFSTISRLTTTMSYTLVTGHESSQNQVFSLTQTLMPRTTAVISSLVDGRSSADH
ncbi:hypothetical protein BRC68_17520 [Halobacteriales archaeon QH_6_64_20]|nr:MAG: hypothetical protein BRC68_17520 [Halobacteriales archaeon QH_6_64_20]